jgi:hypothetical protein
MKCPVCNSIGFNGEECVDCGCRIFAEKQKRVIKFQNKYRDKKKYYKKFEE